MRPFLLALLCCTFIAGTALAQECGVCKIMAPRFQQHYNAGAYDSIFAMFSPEMKGYLPLDKTREFLSDIKAQAGSMNSLDFMGYKKNFAWYRAAFDKDIVEIDFSINRASQFDGLQIKEYDSLKTVERNRTKMSLPFKGQWFVNWGGDTKEQNAHIEALAQRRAFDIVIKDKEGNTHRPGTDGEKNEDYYAFGKELYAPCAGVVVEAIDGLIDNVPGEMNKMYVPGNTVVIKAADSEYVFFAHFKQGSIKVKQGQRVTKGDLLGLCGNSGNSSEPHLHFHLQDGPDINTAIGKKCYFDKLKVNGVTRQDYAPVKDERISVE